ncbi:MAG: hypothetical protein K9N23_04075 [Akkermansiaceae bacterium]|nr:hypothetical protein [Akkermansiaceae bacterium]
MNTISFRLAVVLLACHLATVTAHATGQARAEYLNVSFSQTVTLPNDTVQNINPGVASFGGYIKGSQTQTTNNVVLQQCTYGQAFSQWYPSDTYGSTVVASVRAALYPVTTPTTTRTAIETSGKPFRYKWLLYSGTGTDVTAFDATSIAGWFTQPDRDAIAVQIDVLKDAIAASPLDTSLRNALLDIYYDLAVAEMQAAKPKLAELAKYHLGITVVTEPRKFIIDKEIETYLEIDTAFQAAIARYRALLGTPFPGIDPSSFDPRVPFGTPMGEYIFRREQPRRNSTPSQYANGGGIQEVPDLNGSGQPVTRPSGQILFTGYMDLNALLQIVGQRMQHLASLVELRGTRQNTGDIALGRQALAQAAGADNTDLQLIKSWFPEIFPPDLRALTPAQITTVNLLQQQSGLFAALSAIETGRITLLNLAPFLNGSRNVLGYDPAFLLLVQDTTNQVPPLESYDTLRNMLTGSNQPLTVALDKLNSTPGVNPPDGAKYLYQNFQEKVDKVAADIDNADSALADRYVAITGYEPGDPGFDEQHPNPTAGSELGGTLATITALNVQAQARKPLTANFDDLLAENADKTKAGYAQQGITLAQGKEQALQGAVDKYKGTTGGLYDTNTEAKAQAAGFQAAADAAYAAAGSGLNPTGISASVVAGAINTFVQTEMARTIANNEKYIDFAGIQFSADTEKAGVALTVNQARLDLQGLKRDQIANNLAIQSDISALLQAASQKTALLAELDRIRKKRDGNVAAIRKKSYADPLHYHRAEAALIDADESFRTAQRWMFYTLQALNYKWHGKFAITQGSKTYDTSTVFKCRNAAELNDLLTQMVQWDQIRVTQTTNSLRIISTISLRDHILARNPQRFDPLNASDPGTRADDTVSTTPLPLVSTVQYFRNVLASKYQEAGTQDLVIPFSTAFRNQAPDQVDGSFFRGATYDNATGAVTSPGFWREKIEYVKVKILTTGGSAEALVGGSISYGGTTYFHTRVPPRSDRTVAGLAIDDAPGEMLVSPFRYWVAPDFSQNFVPTSTHLVTSENIPYTATPTAITYDGAGNGLDNAGPPIRAFGGRSIAASGWILRVNHVTGTTILDLSKIKDIEIIIAYKHSNRIPPPN